jgi:predicted alpha/beta-fold hydrolase
MAPRVEEIQTADGDFLEMDWYECDGSDKIVILSHGLEGNSRRRYMRGMAKFMHLNGYHVLAWNYRSCGSRMNRALRFYHSGDTEDIATIIDHINGFEKYKSIYLIGFSMGGNISLKYLGERGEHVNPKIKAAVTFSVPIDLVGSSKVLSKWWNNFYMQRFIRSLRKKIELKSKIYPELNLEGYERIRSFKGFDNKYTAPIHGFEDAFDYWQKSSSLQYLDKITVPVLIVNALNDTFLSETCFPYDIAKNSEFIFLETPKTGGHVGFFSLEEIYWTEKRAAEFLSDY